MRVGACLSLAPFACAATLVPTILLRPQRQPRSMELVSVVPQYETNEIGEVVGQEMSFQLNEQNLKHIMSQVKSGMLVAFVSVVGAFRSGKSFLLSCFWKASRPTRGETGWLFDLEPTHSHIGIAQVMGQQRRCYRTAATTIFLIIMPTINDVVLAQLPCSGYTSITSAVGKRKKQPALPRTPTAF